MKIEIHDIGHPRPIVIYKSLLTAEYCGVITGRLDELLGKPSFQRDDKTPRQFATSKVLPFSDISDLDQLQVIAEITGNVPSTVRRNSQGPRGRQGWHTDYVPCAVVANLGRPKGAIEFKAEARSIEEARSSLIKPNVYIPVSQGDVAIIGCGDELYHRGINTSDEPREQLVFH